MNKNHLTQIHIIQSHEGICCESSMAHRTWEGRQPSNQTQSDVYGVTAHATVILRGFEQRILFYYFLCIKEHFVFACYAADSLVWINIYSSQLNNPHSFMPTTHIYIVHSELPECEQAHEKWRMFDISVMTSAFVLSKAISVWFHPSRCIKLILSYFAIFSVIVNFAQLHPYPCNLVDFFIYVYLYSKPIKIYMIYLLLCSAGQSNRENKDQCRPGRAQKCRGQWC